MSRRTTIKLSLPARRPDPGAIRLDREHSLKRKLEAAPAIAERSAALQNDLGNASLQAQRRHLASSLRVTADISPALWKTFDIARRILSVEERCELYVEASSELNAYCTVLPDGAILVVATSGLVERLDQRELLFLFGHEIGHAVLGHHDIPVHALLHAASQGEKLPMREAFQLLSWSRCCEISADRFGLLCCQDESAARGLFLKLASGLPPHLLGDGTGFEGQVDAWEEGRSEYEGTDFTHPLLPIRVRCARSFMDSEHVTRLFSSTQTAPKWTAEEADAAANRELLRMDPDPDQMHNDEMGDMHRRALALGGTLLVVVDGEVETVELASLAALAGVRAAQEVTQILENCDVEELAQQALAATAAFANHAPLDARTTLVAQLLTIAVVDQHLHENELKVLRMLCTKLGVPEVHLAAALTRLQQGENPLG